MIVFALGSLDPVWATLIISVLVLVCGTLICIKALSTKTDAEVSKQVLTVVGVLFGLLAAGGLGTLFAHSSAETAENAAATAGTAAAAEVSNQVEEKVEKVEEALTAPSDGKSAAPGGK
jgi:hypothetical protein